MKEIFTLLFIFIQFLGNSQTWTQLSDFPGGARDDGSSFIVGTTAFCGMGLKAGTGVTKDFYSFDLATETWSTVAAIPVAGTERQYASGFSGGFFGYIFGGIDAGGNSLNDLWQFHPSSNVWLQKSSKPGAGIYGASSFIINDIAYIIGGTNASTSASSEVWTYITFMSTWVQKNNFPFNGNFRGAAASANGKGYLIFGRDLNNSFNKNLYEYDPGTDTWTYKSTFPGGYGKTYAAMQAINNELIVFSGIDSLNNCSNDLWKYNLVINQWTQLTSLQNPFRKGGMNFTGNGVFYYTTGIDQSNNRLKETWKVDVAVGINELNSEKRITVYPNPTRDFIQLDLKTNEKLNYSIINSLGIEVQKGLVAEGKILFQNLPAGLYTLRLPDPDGNYFSRILIY
jgi:N-acetylneuraminic acid mutarotase